MDLVSCFQGDVSGEHAEPNDRKVRLLQMYNNRKYMHM